MVVGLPRSIGATEARAILILSGAWQLRAGLLWVFGSGLGGDRGAGGRGVSLSDLCMAWPHPFLS